MFEGISLVGIAIVVIMPGGIRGSVGLLTGRCGL